MEETYTFSRALHLMRYGGKKMRREHIEDEFFCVQKENILRSVKINGVYTMPVPTNGVPSCSIMGSWVEVKQ